MKLRSESSKVAASATPIPFMLSATQAITISNASSPLLRLPQELKDRIYHFAFSGFVIDVQAYGYNYRLYIYGAQSEFPNASVCRQMYHDVTNVLYSANTYLCVTPSFVCSFIKHNNIFNRNLAVRSIVLKIIVRDAADERNWNNALCALAESSKNLRHIRIDIREFIWNGPFNNWHRYSAAFGKRPFLEGLLELKKLPLQTMELDATAYRWSSGKNANYSGNYCWTDAQKKEWARKIRGAILSSE